MNVYHTTVSATATNSAVTLPFKATNLLIDNIGTDDVFVNVSGTGIAVASGATNIRVRATTNITLIAGRGEDITLVGLICASTKTATVYLTASVN